VSKIDRMPDDAQPPSLPDDQPLCLPDNLAGCWNVFANGFLGGCSPLQCQEMRRAFYAGAESLWVIIMGPDEADAARMVRIHGELVQFATAIKEGRA
jgi:hypothetical protein